MIPGPGNITLWRIDVHNPKKWIVKVAFSAEITDVRRNNDETVRLVAQIQQQSYVCQRPIQPVNLEQLKASAWSMTSSGRRHGSSDSFIVEAVIALNASRFLGMGPQALLLDGAIRSSAVPHRDNAYCGAHDRAHYWEDRCPACVSTRKAA